MKAIEVITEAVDPKRVMRQMQRFNYKEERGGVTIIDPSGSSIRYSTAYSGTPVITAVKYSNKVAYGYPQVEVGKRLMQAACDYARSKQEYRVRVMTGTTTYEDETGFWRDVDRDDGREIGHLFDPNTYMMASGAVRYLTLESVLDLDPASGKLRYDPKRPKGDKAIWTYQRHDELNNPHPYIRNIRLENGKALEIIIAYRKQNAPMDLLKAVKLYGPQVATVARKAADHIAWALLKRAPVHIVMPMPSSKPLARRFARLLANETGAEFMDSLSKTKEMKAVPILKRWGAANDAFAVQGRYRGKTVLIVDDYIVTASSMHAVANRLYQAGAKRVIGAALAV